MDDCCSYTALGDEAGWPQRSSTSGAAPEVGGPRRLPDQGPATNTCCTSTSTFLSLPVAPRAPDYIVCLTKGGDHTMFTYVASASPRGNENIRRVCSHCSGVFYVTFNAQNYRCPHCNWQCG